MWKRLAVHQVFAVLWSSNTRQLLRHDFSPQSCLCYLSYWLVKLLQGAHDPFDITIWFLTGVYIYIYVEMPSPIKCIFSEASKAPYLDITTMNLTNPFNLHLKVKETGCRTLFMTAQRHEAEVPCTIGRTIVERGSSIKSKIDYAPNCHPPTADEK